MGGRTLLVVDCLHIRSGTSMPFQESCVHFIKARSFLNEVA
jgi:hypothetical protein